MRVSHVAALRGDTRGRDGGVREELAAGIGLVLINAQIAVPAFFKCPQRPSSMVYTVKVHLQRILADLMFPPHVKAGEGEMNPLWFWEV
jgi:hypothetical protein